uniref:Uncharacterized protein n=1 Tax=Magallana gigas TaxID=29159 RepID=A0A8W8IJR3_MAGGI
MPDNGQVSLNSSHSPKPFYKERQLLNMSPVSISKEDRNGRSVESFLSVPPAMDRSTSLTSVPGKWSTPRGNKGACITT